MHVGYVYTVPFRRWFTLENAAVLRKRINWPQKRISIYNENAWKSASKRMEKVYKNASI